jgi:hypothetical protein
MATNAASGIMFSDIVSSFGVVKDVEWRKLMQPFEDQGATFFQELISMGYEDTVANTVFNHTELERYTQIFTVANIADPGAGVQADLVVQAAYVDNNTVFARVGDVIMNPANQVQLRVQAKTGATITVKPLVAAESIGVVAAGATYVIVSSAFGFGTGQPEAAYSKVARYAHKTQILKETTAADGSTLTNALWTPVMEDGKATPSYYSIQLAAAEYRMYQKIDGALLVGVEADNVTDENGRAIQTTKGLIPTAAAADGFLGATTLNLAGLRSIDAHMRKQFTPGLVCGWLGVNKWEEFTDNNQALLANTGINQINKAINKEVYGGNEAWEAVLDFTAVTVNGRKFMMKNMKTWDNPMTFNSGVAGNPYQDYGLFIPLGKTQDGEGNMKNYMGVRFKANNGYNRKMVITKDGMAGPGLSLGDLDQDITYMLSDVGAHYMKTNQWAFITG